MNTDREHAVKHSSRKTDRSQLPAEIVLQPPHNSPHHRNLQPLKSAIHRHPAYSSQFPTRKMEHVHYPPSVGHSQIPAIVRPAVVQSVSTIILIIYLTNGIPKRIRRPITIPTRLADLPQPRVIKPKSNNTSKFAPAPHTSRPSIIKNDTSRPHTPVIPGQYAPQPPIYTHAKGEATILHLDPPATRFPLPTPIVPTVIHTPAHAPVAPVPLNIQRKRWRHNYLEAYKASLDAEAENHFVREQVAPLNPVLSAPPIPFCYFGTLKEKFFEMELFQGVLEDMNPLPQIAWDVRCAPSTLVITARPYPFSDPTLTKKQMKRRALLDHNEVLRLYGQASTNPPYVILFFSCQGFETEIVRSRCTVGQTIPHKKI
jgi:hypothetical protein